MSTTTIGKDLFLTHCYLFPMLYECSLIYSALYLVSYQMRMGISCERAKIEVSLIDLPRFRGIHVVSNIITLCFVFEE